MKVMLNGNLASDPKVVSDKLTVITVTENNSKDAESKPEFFEVSLSGEAKKQTDSLKLKKGDLVAVEGYGHVEKVKEGEKYFNDLTIWGKTVALKYKAGSKK